MKIEAGMLCELIDPKIPGFSLLPSQEKYLGVLCKVECRSHLGGRGYPRWVVTSDLDGSEHYPIEPALRPLPPPPLPAIETEKELVV